ncbi:MAG TPA: glycosyltransferase, partial [Thermoleophilaceae bacterium]|nr:glycosyltransferase [Thermoleophilaceae bacterium]
MALRLTTASASKTTNRSAAEYAALARTHLSRGDTAAYLALFNEVAGEQDPHRGFRARRTLLEVAMATAAPARLMPKLLLAGARAAVDVLEEEPREPLFLNYAGVLLYELGALNSAEQLFKAAKRLDPDLPHVARNLDELARRRRKNIDLLRRLPPQVGLELGSLAKRVERVIGRATPAGGMRISLTMIVKDEEEMLPRCLAAVREAVDEMIVVDTGSTDRTIEIARSFGAKVIEREWTGSFA